MSWSAEAETRHGILEFPKGDQYVGKSLALYGEFSKEETDLFAKVVNPGDTVVEVGANVGALTVPLCKIVGDKGAVIAMEPQRILYSLLFKNLVRNNCLHATPMHAAAGRAAGMLSVPVVNYAEEGNFGGISMSLGGEGEAVAVIPVDSLGLKELRLLKIDVEGMEAEVLLGAKDTIRELRPLLFVENDREQKSEELISLIRDMGYNLWWHVTPLYAQDNFRGNGENAFPGIVSINMLCVPREATADIDLPPVRGPKDHWRQAYMTPKEDQPKAQKTCAVVRLGAYGDALWASSLFPHLKAEGYRLTVYTGDRGMEVLKHDPHVDEFIHLKDGAIPLQELSQYFHYERAKYDKWVQLLETVENFLLLDPRNYRYFWPKEVRHQHCDVNYLEFIHDIAGVPHEWHQKFYATAEETEWARTWRREIKQLVVLAISGSGVHKWYPHIGELAEQLLEAYPDMHVVAQGDDRGAKWPVSHRFHRPEWSIRQAMTMCQHADLVIGQETALLNAVAFEEVAKIVLLSHSTEENLTKHWRNVRALTGGVPCGPCHRLHFGWDHCHKDERTQAAACQSAIPLGTILAAVAEKFSAAQRHEHKTAA